MILLNIHIFQRFLRKEKTMKNLRVIALLLAALMLVSVVLVSCAKDEPGSATTTPANTKKTTAPLPDRPDGPSEDGLDDPPEPENPVTGDDFEAWAEQFTKVQIIGVETQGFNAYGDAETAEKICDDDLTTKMAGTSPLGEITITFECPSSTIAAYAFYTANDSNSYERTPGAWILYGSTKAPGEAKDEDWRILDDVKNGGTDNVADTPFGYEIDAANQGAYSYYKIVFKVGVNYEYGLTNFQLSEFLFYTK